jgi:iron(III) transport system permease protein
MTIRSFSVPRTVVVAVTTLVIFLPIGLIFWQSFLNAPFFNPAHRYGFDAYAFIFEDSDFWNAFLNSVVIAAGMVIIALPLGAALAFLLTRTDLPAQRTIEAAFYRTVVSRPRG